MFAVVALGCSPTEGDLGASTTTGNTAKTETGAMPTGISSVGSGSSSAEETDGAEDTKSTSDGETTSSEASTGASEVLDCGNGAIDPGEDCDDGNLEDADGCNADCVVSGSTLWVYDFPLQVDRISIVIGLDDTVHALGWLYDDMLYFHVSAEGEELEQRQIEAPINALPGTLYVDRRIHGFSVLPGDVPIYSITDLFFENRTVNDSGYLGSQRQLRADGEWSMQWGDGAPFRFVVSESHVLGSGDDFLVITADGEVVATGPPVRGNNRLATPDGAVFAAQLILSEDLLGYGMDGQPQWSVHWPDGSVYSLARIADDILAFGGTENAPRFVRYSTDGAIINELFLPADGPLFYGTVTATPQGHIGLVDGSHVQKLDGDYSVRWDVDFEDGISGRVLSDSAGALFVTQHAAPALPRSLLKLAP